MKRQTIIRPASCLGAILLLGSASAALGGIQHIVAPPPPKECDGCTEPGLYVHASLLYMKSYNSEIADYRGEWDAGFRGGIGWESPTGLFFELSGLYHQTDFEGENGVVSGEHEFYYLDFTVGDTVHCGELCVAFAGGLRWGGNDFDEDWGGMRNKSEFEGIGPVFKVEATRDLTERFALYGNLTQALLFGEDDYNGFTTDTLLAITEVGAGVQYNFALASLDAFLRAGVEGQYWFEDGGNIGLFGGVFSLGGRF